MDRDIISFYHKNSFELKFPLMLNKGCKWFSWKKKKSKK